MVALTKRKARRAFKKQKQQVGELTESASQHIDRHIFRRLNNFADVGRFISAWILLFLMLIGGVVLQTRGLSKYYLINKSVDGGVLTEGIVGTFTTPNPLFASSTVDMSVSKLLFNSLLTYDSNGALINDLAESVSRAQSGLEYTVKLRKDVVWQDGDQFDAKDVVYTYTAIQNPETRSPYNVSWRGVTIKQVDDYTVSFSLPAPINAFPLSLTTGIVPEHILSKEDYSQLRSSEFNAKPIGTGPFKLVNVVRSDDFEEIAKRQRIETASNERYFKGTVGLDALVIHTVTSDEELKEFLANRTIDSAVFNSYQEELGDEYITQTIPLLAGSYLFFNTSKAPFESVELRRAVAQSIDVVKLISELGYPVQKVDSPLLATHVGYNPEFSQVSFDKIKASEALDALGWKRSSDGRRVNAAGEQLSFTITTLSDSDLSTLSAKIQQSLSQEFGIKVDISTKKPAEIQPVLLQHSYQAVLYGITMGNDPDVYAYWHSSQAVSDRFNLSMYKSDIADQALEAGRSRPDVELREAKYKPFLEAWQKDVPALGFYQPPIFYVSRTKVHNFTPARLGSTPDRFANVHTWQILSDERPIIEKK